MLGKNLNLIEFTGILKESIKEIKTFLLHIGFTIKTLEIINSSNNKMDEELIQVTDTNLKNMSLYLKILEPKKNYFKSITDYLNGIEVNTEGQKKTIDDYLYNYFLFENYLYSLSISLRDLSDILKDLSE